MALSLVPLVLVAMNLVYSACAYPFGKLSDRVSHRALLGGGLLILVAADLVLASSASVPAVFLGVVLWGVHLGITQGLFATMIAHAAPADLRGTAFGFFNVMSGIALLVASALAGLLWDLHGASFTFHAGAVFASAALLCLAWAPKQDYANHNPDSFWRTHAWRPLLAFAAVFFVLEFFALDPVIARAWYFDVQTMHWLGTGPGDWWARGVLHTRRAMDRPHRRGTGHRDLGAVRSRSRGRETGVGRQASSRWPWCCRSPSSAD